MWLESNVPKSRHWRPRSTWRMGSMWFRKRGARTGAVKRGQISSRVHPGRGGVGWQDPGRGSCQSEHDAWALPVSGPDPEGGSPPNPDPQVKAKVLSKSKARAFRTHTEAEAESHPVLFDPWQSLSKWNSSSHRNQKARWMMTLLQTTAYRACTPPYGKQHFRLSTIPKQKHQRQQSGRKRNTLISSRTPNTKETDNKTWYQTKNKELRHSKQRTQFRLLAVFPHLLALASSEQQGNRGLCDTTFKKTRV